MPPLGLAARLAGTAALLLALGGCLVNSEEFDQAQRLKETLWTELSRQRQDNDQLKHEINRLYSDREILSGHVAMTSAVALHNYMTARTRPASPEAAPAPPPQAPRPAPPARPASAPRPAAAQTARPAAPPPPPAAPPLPPASDTLTPPVIRSRAVDWGQ